MKHVTHHNIPTSHRLSIKRSKRRTSGIRHSTSILRSDTKYTQWYYIICELIVWTERSVRLLLINSRGDNIYISVYKSNSKTTQQQSILVKISRHIVYASRYMHYDIIMFTTRTSTFRRTIIHIMCIHWFIQISGMVIGLTYYFVLLDKNYLQLLYLTATDIIKFNVIILN